VTLPGYPTLPAAADFPILDDCQSGGPCARGYWIQILVFDPTGRSLDDAAFDPFTWSVDASVSYPEGAQPPTDGLSVVADTGPAGIATPPSLVLRGPGGTFHVDDAHVVTSLTIDAHLEPRATAPVFGDGRAGVTIIFNLRSYATPGSSAGAPDSYLWLSNGHYVGDGSTGDDQADTGGWGGPGRMAYPPGRPLAACAGVVTACTSQTGLVVHRYTDSFAHGDQVTTFEVAWDWVVIGAPPDASVEVVAQDGETPLAGTNEIPGSTSRGVLVLVALALVMVAAVVGNALINRRKRLRRP
jgi:hypothetical protein